MGSDEHAGSADTTLRGAKLHKRLLKLRKLPVVCEPFDGQNIAAADLTNGYQAAVNDFSVYQDGARAAFAFATTFLRACESQVFPEHVEQPAGPGSINVNRLAVHRKRCHCVSAL